jgi:hypothetical protein
VIPDTCDNLPASSSKFDHFPRNIYKFRVGIDKSLSPFLNSNNLFSKEP